MIEIRLQRMLKGIKMKELADRIGINSSHLSKIERGMLTPRKRLRDRILKEIGLSE